MNRTIWISFIFCAFFFTQNHAQTKDLNISADPMIDNLVSLKAQMTRDYKIDQRFMIQLGSYNSRAKAEDQRSKYRSKYNQWSVYLEYEAPNYKVWVGDFTSRLAADRAFQTLKKDFRSAFIFKPTR